MDDPIPRGKLVSRGHTQLLSPLQGRCSLGTPASCPASAPTSSLAPLHTLMAAVVLCLWEAQPGPDRSLGSQICRFALCPAPFPSSVTLLFSEATSIHWASPLQYMSQVTADNRCPVQEDALSLVLKPGSGLGLHHLLCDRGLQCCSCPLLSFMMVQGNLGNSGVLLRRTVR